MTHSQVKSPQRQYPLLYWSTLAYIVGFPNFIHFDNTGRTRMQLNASSIGLVVEAVLMGYLLVVMLLLDRRPVIPRKVNISGWLWMGLFSLFLLATFLEPASRSTAKSGMDLWLSLFLLGQWVVGFVAIIALYSRTAPGLTSDLVVRMIGRISWIWIAMVWFILPIMPSQAFGASEEGSAAVRRLGGGLIHPGKLAILACFAFFYAVLFFPRGLRKWAACIVALVTLALTGARTGQAGFVLALVLYAIVFSRKPAFRWGALGLIGFLGVLAVGFSDTLLKYVARGQSLATLASLDDRTRIWQASLEAFRARPFLGYGYCVGARNALRDHWKFVHWVPPHSHNEFIQAALEGGIFAVALVICIYVLVLWRLIRSAQRSPYHIFLLLTFIQFIVTTMSGPILTYWFGTLGGIFLLCCIESSAGIPQGMSRTIKRMRSSPRKVLVGA